MSVAGRRRAKEEATLRTLGTAMVPPSFLDDDAAAKTAQRKPQKAPVAAAQGIASERTVGIIYAVLVALACATAGFHKFFSANLDLALTAGAVIVVTLGTWFAAKCEPDRAGSIVPMSFLAGFMVIWASFSLVFALPAGALLGRELVRLNQAYSRSVRITNTPAVLVRSRFRRRVIWDLLPLTPKVFRVKLAAQTGKRNHLLQLTRDGHQLLVLCSPQQQYVVYFTAAPIYNRGEDSWHRLMIPTPGVDADNTADVEFVTGKHKLQFPRRAVVSRLDATLAAEAFIATGNPLPRFTWESGREVTRQLPPREIQI